MTMKIRPNMINELQNYGAFDVSACFNCGACTASCPIVEENAQFPRQLIRLAQLGQKDKLLASKELWTCYYCGECSDSCPREANPGEFMAAARRYAIAEYDVTRIGSFTYKHPKLTTLGLVVFGLVMAFFATFVDKNDPIGHNEILMLGHDYYDAIHYVGMVAAGILTVIVLVNMFRMYQFYSNNSPLRQRKYIMDQVSRKSRIKIAFSSLMKIVTGEVIKQKTFNTGVEKKYDPTSRWFVHMTIFCGFMGLLAATGLNYMVKDLLLDEPNAAVPIYYPIRMLGILSGLLLIYGTSIALYKRYKKDGTYYSNSTYTDYLFLWLLWATGVSGYVVTYFVYTPESQLPDWAHWTLIIHIIIAIELLLMLPFSKMGHAMYRPIALWVNQMEKELVNSIDSGIIALLPTESDPESIPIEI